MQLKRGFSDSSSTRTPRKVYEKKLIEQEIQDLEKQIQPHDTGHIHTTINTLKHQYKQLTGFEWYASEHDHSRN